jgi:xylitol oxidase
VTADGTTLVLDRSSDEFAGVVLALGALGVVTRVWLDVEPSYLVRQDIYRELDWDVALTELDKIMAAGYSVSLFTTWAEPSIARVLVKTRLDSDGGAVPHELFGAVSMGHDDPQIADLGNNRTVLGGVPGPWCDRLPHFRLDAVPSSGSEIQSEYFVDRRDGADALRVLRELADVIAPHLITSEIRSTAADALWLSMSYQRPSLAIHFTWRNHPESVARLLPRIEAALAPFGARPHWGKAFAMTAADIRPLYPRIDDFAALCTRMDPTGKFRNDYLRRVLGI